MMKKSELMVITETKRLIDYVFLVTEKSPKKFRYSFVNKIHNLLIEIIELLYEANSIDVMDVLRLSKQESALVKFQILDYLCELATREKCLLFHQYENISNYLNSCMKYLNGWINSDKKKKKLIKFMGYGCEYSVRGCFCFYFVRRTTTTRAWSITMATSTTTSIILITQSAQIYLTSR